MNTIDQNNDEILGGAMFGIYCCPVLHGKNSINSILQHQKYLTIQSLIPNHYHLEENDCYNGVL